MNGIEWKTLFKHKKSGASLVNQVGKRKKRNEEIEKWIWEVKLCYTHYSNFCIIYSLIKLKIKTYLLKLFVIIYFTQ